jgi:hypothetical protein
MYKIISILLLTLLTTVALAQVNHNTTRASKGRVVEPADTDSNTVDEKVFEGTQGDRTCRVQHRGRTITESCYQPQVSCPNTSNACTVNPVAGGDILTGTTTNSAGALVEELSNGPIGPTNPLTRLEQMKKK